MLKRLQHGAVMAEFALVIPVLLAVIFFITEIGSVLYLLNSLNQVARSAARFAAVSQSFTQQDLINASGADSLLPDINNFDLTITPNIGIARRVGDTITINVQYTYTPIINPFGLLDSATGWLPDLMSASVSRAEVSSAG